MALIAVTGVVAVGCGSSSDSSSKASSASTRPAGPAQPGPFCGASCKTALELRADPASVKGKVGLSLNSLAFSYGVAMKQEGEDEAKRYFPGMELTVTDGQGSVQKQSADVDDLVARGIRVLLISPYQADSLVPAIRRAQQAGVKVITVDRNANTDVESFISSDDVANGEAVGEAMARALRGRGRIIEITGTPGASPTVARGGGFHRAIARYPGLRVIATANGDYLPASALRAMSDLLGRYPKGSFDAIYTHADDMAGGIAQALKEAGREKDGIWMGSINGQRIGFQLIERDQLQATAAYATVAREGVMAAAKELAGESLPRRIVTEAALVDRANVADYVSKVNW
jgi:ribose transport system substrate-binding protein